MDVLKKIIRILMLALGCSQLSGCLFTYLVDSGYNQIKLINSGKSIEEVLKDETISPDLRKKLELTLEVRKFIVDNLKLKSTKNYQNYVDLKRPHVTYIVTVAHKNKLEPKLFWYPFVGSLPYKGYFKKEQAEREARSFDSKKYDVMVRGVSAYSTLGWFNDPLLSSMLSGDDHHLVNTLIHESTHATLFIKSNADFNERLATYVGNIGTEIFYLSKEGDGSPTVKKIKDDSHDEKIFSEFITNEIKALRDWYKTLPEDWESQREKKFAEIQNKFLLEVQPKLKTDNYNKFASSKLNNAILLYFDTYLADLNAFDELFVYFKKDFSRFITFCKSLEKSRDPIQSVKSQISLPDSSEPNP